MKRARHRNRSHVQPTWAKVRKHWQLLLVIGVLGLLAPVSLLSAVEEVAGSSASVRKAAQTAMQNGNFKDAYEGFRRLALDKNSNPKKVGGDLERGLQCLRRLNRTNETDAFREATIEAHAGNWRLLQTAANTMNAQEHYGYMISGQFERGRHRGGGKVVSSLERDRVRSLQLMKQAMDAVGSEPNRDAAARFYVSFAEMILGGRGHRDAWRLQSLTNLDELPDYEPGWPYGRGQSSGAPVDADGKPVFHETVKAWGEAKTDGERWRFCLDQAVACRPYMLDQTRRIRADFLRNQFGVQTMAYYGRFFGRQGSGDSEKDQSGTYALHTLGENETIAKLAVGVRRFELPDEHNFIKLYQSILEDPKAGREATPSHKAVQSLAELFENRRQYPRAAEYWRQAIALSEEPWKRDRLQQIVGVWGRFEPTMTQPAGKGATIEFRFRNGKHVDLTAHKIRVKPLLDDVKAYLKSNPGRVDWQKVNISNIGHRLVTQNQEKYRGQKVAQWRLDLKPRDAHFDRRITISTPLQEAGAYLLKAKMDDGNVSQVIVWLADTAIVKKPLDDKALYYVADAVTGQPIAKANLELFGYRVENVGQNRYSVAVKQFAEFTDADGMATQPFRKGPRRRPYQWFATATTQDGRFAYLGYTSVWSTPYREQQYRRTKVFTITDRPVYRPNQKVQYKFWVRRAQYDQEDTSHFAGRDFIVEVYNPKHEKILTKNMTADEYGGLSGELELPGDAALGVYRVSLKNHGGGTFRVEEYKKPEFEVTVEAPEEPVSLGEKISATIRAKYYFGSPVNEAKVKYKVLRTAHNDRWYPHRPWDWLYGRGYGWFAQDYAWYPGWSLWGCGRPYPHWYPQRRDPPEVVAEQTTEIGEDGTVKIELDTALAKAVHGDQDHRYEIVAEVTDRSRRTIVGRGQVLVAREPFRVTVWTQRGYYRVGDTINARFSVRTIDNKPVSGEGQLELLSIRYDEQNKPVETVVETWKLDPDAEGSASQKLAASNQGQFRLRYRVTDKQGHSIEGGQVFTVIGEGFDGRQFRFNDLELITDRREYQAGDTVRLQVNTNRVGAAVLLFVRPSNGVYLPPKLLRIAGKSTVVDVGVTKKDMPNFFIEAVTVHGAKLHTEVCEVYVPPEKRILEVEVLPSADEFKPGERGKITVKLTDLDGKPFVGSTVLAMYDKSVEYISGGSNVGEIKEFFWKWRRRHHPQNETNLGRWFRNLVLPKKKPMSDIGVFGATAVDDGAKGTDQVFSFNLGVQNWESKGMRRSSGRSAGPMAAPATMALADSAEGAAPEEPSGVGGGGGGGLGANAGPAMVEPTVRTKFADTALWRAALETNQEGVAEIELDMPENLTAWMIRCWAMGQGTKVGQGQTEVVTRKNLIVRLQAPRFFVETDEVVLSANVHNYLKDAKEARVTLEVEGDTLSLDGSATQTVHVDADGETRVDWRVKVVGEGQAVVRMKALTDEESDAMQMDFPVYVHGMEKMESFTGVIRPEQSQGGFTYQVPEKRRAEQSRLEVRYSPTLAGAMVDALPYLIDYPYGCTEQTLNRFLPAVITQKVLLDMKLDLKAIRDKRTNLNSQEIGDDRERAEGWKHHKTNPVFDEEELQAIVKAGVQRLTEMQLSDGGWGWFSGYRERSYPHTTAVVVHGLQVAEANGVALVPGVLEQGEGWLKQYQAKQIRRLKNVDAEGKVIDKNKPSKRHADNLDALIYMVIVDSQAKDDSPANQTMQDFLYRDRNHLAVYAKATFGLSLHRLGEKEKLAMIMQNIEQFLVEDKENQTAYLNLPGGQWWRWYGSEYEAHAYYLKLLAATEPKSEKAAGLVKYLLNNRKHATYWNSTRDTALCVEAMADYLRASGEDKPDLTVEVWLDGEKKKEIKITADDLFTFDNKLVLEGADVEAGVHKIELRKKGKGPLYWNGYLTNFTLEDHITQAGLELKVERKYFKITPVDKEIEVAGDRGQVLNQKVEKYERTELPNLATVKSGDLIEIELTFESKNDYEYVLLEDMKAAGFEPVDTQSGYYSDGLTAYRELRDDRVSLFLRRLARGRNSISYRMRAEIPGRFSALPSRMSAMYAPELKANSDEIKIKVVD